jgi:mRNA-degrading endonuclease RelE of RelBE toxin-antitoxin system
MYEVELSAAAVTDLEDFNEEEVQEILSLLLIWEETPKPEGVQAIPLEEAADGMAYLYETDTYSIYYDIFETAQVVKIVAIFKKINLN